MTSSIVKWTNKIMNFWLDRNDPTIIQVFCFVINPSILGDAIVLLESTSVIHLDYNWVCEHFGVSIPRSWISKFKFCRYCWMNLWHFLKEKSQVHRRVELLDYLLIVHYSLHYSLYFWWTYQQYNTLSINKLLRKVN